MPTDHPTNSRTDPRTAPTRRSEKGVDQETGDPGRSSDVPAVSAPDASADPGTNRTHPEPDDTAEAHEADGKKHAEKSPYTAGQQ